MQPHIKNYFKAFGYDESSVILCELCGSVASDVHHVLARSKFGKKRKAEQDNVNNLVALCRLCHNKAHDNIVTKEFLLNIIEKRKVNL